MRWVRGNLGRLGLVASAALFLVPTAQNEARADLLNALVPAYFYPAGSPNLDYWHELDVAAHQIHLTAIMNQNSGVVTDQDKDQNYVNVTNALVANGGQVLGYLNTSQLQRAS
jgi:hypothetical protein